MPPEVAATQLVAEPIGRTGAFLKLYKIAQSQSALELCLQGSPQFLHNEASAASSIVQGGRKRRDSSIKAFGDLLDEQGRSEAAIECLRKALRTAPDHTDAMLALLLQRENQYRRGDRLLAPLSCY